MDHDRDVPRHVPLGGKIQDRTGPRWVAVAGILMYRAGVALASLARTPELFWLLMLTYG